MVQISRLPHDPGPAGWDALLPARVPGPALEGPQTADWLVIGAGFTGLAAARRLRALHPGDRIALLEARALCDGPVARNSGFMIDLPHVLSSTSYAGTGDEVAQIRANRAAIDFARAAVTDYDIPAEAFDPIGKINGAMSAAAAEKNQTYRAHLSDLGEASELLDARQMQDITGSHAYTSGLYTPGTVVLQPAMFARAMAAGLTREGVDIFEHSPVIALDQSGGTWTAKTPKGRITAPAVILAVNGQIERFGHFRKRLMHVFLYASMTRALSPDQVRALGGAAKWGITPSDPMGSTVRRISGTGGDRIVVRNSITWDPALRGDDRHLKKALRRQHAGLVRRFPALAQVNMEYTWGGALCLSRNDTPAFGEVAPRLFAAACQNGLGSVHGTLSGMLAADLASGQGSDLLTWQLGLPTPAPLAPLSNLGAPPVLAWREWRARGEI